MSDETPAIYILTNRYRGCLYIGVTSNLVQRIYQHKEEQLEGFTQRYQLKKLVYFEAAETMESAIAREKQLKAGSRQKKLNLIESANPQWLDLYPQLL